MFSISYKSKSLQNNRIPQKPKSLYQHGFYIIITDYE
jgi:hypothetical protein